MALKQHTLLQLTIEQANRLPLVERGIPEVCGGQQLAAYTRI